MTTVNMKKVGNSFQPESIELDPYSEYEHVDEPVQEPNNQMASVAQQPLQPKEQLFKNIDDLFEGANLVFDLANHVMKKLNGGR